MQENYAKYLRKYFKANSPLDWKKFNVDGFINRDFPGMETVTVTDFQKYFGLILDANKNKKKIAAIEERFNLTNYNTVEKKIEIINGKPRFIEKFFRDSNLTPQVKNIEFIAFIFDAPIKSLKEFTTYFMEQKNAKENLQIVKSSEFIAEKPVVLKVTLPFKISETQKEEASPISTPISQQKEIQKQNIEVVETENVNVVNTVKIQKRHHTFSFAFAAVAAIVLGFFFLFPSAEKEAKSSPVKEVKIKSLIPVYAGDSLFIGTMKSNLPPQTTPFIKFKTTKIYNDEFVYSPTNAWSFETDPEGEDMNSSYGGFIEENIHTLYPVQSGKVTLANQNMYIKFDIQNRLGKKLRFTNFKISVEKTYDVKAENAKYNLYENRGIDKLLKITLSNNKNYLRGTDNKEIKDGENLLCHLYIDGDNFCNDLIYKFNIVCELIDSDSKLYTIKSDKSYFLGFKEQTKK